MWRRQRPRKTQVSNSGARQRITATYAVVVLAIVLLWLLPLPTASTLSAQLIALATAFVAVHVTWWMYGWRMEAASLFRQAAAREMARRGYGRVVLIDGIAGWGWPVGLFVVVADHLGGGGMSPEAALLQFVIWSLAGIAVGQILWSLSDDPALEATPQRVEPVLTPSPSPTPAPANDAANTAADLLLSSRA